MSGIQKAVPGPDHMQGGCPFPRHACGGPAGGNPRVAECERPVYRSTASVRGRRTCGGQDTMSGVRAKHELREKGHAVTRPGAGRMSFPRTWR